MVPGVFLLSVILAWTVLSVGPALAEGDLAAGKKIYKRCLVCHPAEEGKKKIGPTLYKLYGRTAGTAEGFKYSPAYVRAGKKGLVWNEENLLQYLKNPKKFLRAFLKDPKVKSRMTMKYFKERDRRNVIEYLRSFAD